MTPEQLRKIIEKVQKHNLKLKKELQVEMQRFGEYLKMAEKLRRELKPPANKEPGDSG